MASPEVLALLVRLTLAATLALAIVFLLRRPMRRAFGLNAAYAVWTLVPALMLASAFSRVAPQGTGVPVPVMPLQAPMPTAGLVEAAAPMDVAGVILGAWSIGLVLWLSMRVVAQWRWRSHIGALRHAGNGTAYGASDPSLPAAVGWPRAVVVLPADFDVRFSENERALVLEHERRHIARGDLHAQMIAEMIRALLWFHPLVHWAAVRFRHDQELACDADVIASRPADSATYARALAGAAGLRLPPVATAWGFSHPLKERLAMLQLPPRSMARQRVGLAMITLLTLLASSVVWAALAREASAPAEGVVRQTWTLTIDGGEALGPFLLVDRPGVPVEIRFEEAGETWSLRSSATPLPEGRFDLQTTISRGANVVAEPRLIIDATGGAIQIGGQSPTGFRGVKAEVQVEAGEGTGLAAEVPAYPEGLAQAGVEGRVLLRVTVDAEGRAADVRVESSSGNVALDESARTQALGWRFPIERHNGPSASHEVLVPVDFRANPEGVDTDA